MKIFYLFLVGFSLSSLAQTRSGSGGIISPEHQDGVGNPSDKISTFIQVLQYSERACRGKGQIHMNVIDQDFMKTYIKLSLATITFVPDSSCKSLDEYFKCLSEKSVKSSLHNILKDEGSIDYLMKQYSIEKKQAESMLDYYKRTFLKD